jgi:hypothetical protein
MPCFSSSSSSAKPRAQSASFREPTVEVEGRYIGTVGRTRENKFRAQTCADKFTASAFRESEEVCLVEFLKRGATVHSERYVQILKKLKQPILRFRPNMRWTKLSSCMTTPDGTQVCAQWRHLQQWSNCSPSSSLQSRFITLPFFGFLKDAVLRKTRSWNTACVKSCDTSVSSFTQPT